MKVLPDNIMFIDKPKGITSFDVIRVLRKKLGVRKLGHAGTLDPLASGLLIVGVGEGTAKLNKFLKLPKEYNVEILLGIATDTGDLEGRVTGQKFVSLEIPNSKSQIINKSQITISKTQIKHVLENITGVIELLVPTYSAVKQRGVPLYKRARRGEKIELPKKKMEIKKIRLLNLFQEGKHMILKLEMEVESGTYVRSVTEEIGRRLGVPAMVKDLRRIKIGKFDISQAQKLDDV